MKSVKKCFVIAVLAITTVGCDAASEEPGSRTEVLYGEEAMELIEQAGI